MRHLAAALTLCLVAAPEAVVLQPAADPLVFDASRFTLKSAIVDGRTVDYRAYEGIVYVRNPVDASVQRMNIYVPVACSDGAPIFLPNNVGGYMPAQPGSPGTGRNGGPNAALVALSKGYVVASPGARGRTTQDPAGRYTGKAPAVIVDLKAAVRYLRFNDARMPGDAEKIISNGTSAGGAVSALLGTSGNHPDFEPALKALGAAEARDDIFATSAYCPITNLEHADAAYEWQFNGVNEYVRFAGRPPAGPGAPGAAPPPQTPTAPPAPRVMSAEQIALSALLKAQFPAYVNGLRLKKTDGTTLTLDASGDGPFKDVVKSYLIASAQRALDAGKDLSAATWLTIVGGRVTAADFATYAKVATRMKVTPAFDGLDLTSPENDLFGNETTKARHFTAFGQEHTAAAATLAEPALVRQMNAMAYIGAKDATTAKYWRIRHGAIDRDTSLAIPVILATALQNAGTSVDFDLPWGVGHSGDYDLDELFAWIAKVGR
jgi:acetyl esterase/lipase